MHFDVGKLHTACVCLRLCQKDKRDKRDKRCNVAESSFLWWGRWLAFVDSLPLLSSFDWSLSVGREGFPACVLNPELSLDIWGPEGKNMWLCFTLNRTDAG